MSAFESIIVVGGSGTGKTTLVNGLRSPLYEGSVVIPHLYTTRPERTDDKPDAISRIKLDAFLAHVATGSMYPYWSRTFENDREEAYGFEAVTPDDDRLRIYTSTNPFARPTFKRILETGLVVALKAFPTTRTDRIFAREVDPSQMSVGELKARLVDGELSIPKGVANHVLDTSFLSPEEGQEALRNIVDEVLSNAK